GPTARGPARDRAGRRERRLELVPLGQKADETLAREEPATRREPRALSRAPHQTRLFRLGERRADPRGGSDPETSRVTADVEARVEPQGEHRGLARGGGCEVAEAGRSL